MVLNQHVMECSIGYATMPALPLLVQLHMAEDKGGGALTAPSAQAGAGCAKPC